jgi:nucleoside-diphosphate-sugar epimerase
MGQPLTVWRTALDQKRPYLDLADALQAFALVMSQDIRSGEVLNVVTENATVRRVVDSIRRKVPDLVVELVESPIMNQLSYEVASGRIRQLGFFPAGSLDDAVAATVARLHRCQSLART